MTQVVTWGVKIGDHLQHYRNKKEIDSPLKLKQAAPYMTRNFYVNLMPMK